MNQTIQAVNSNALAIVPAKRKRGRPRKYPTAGSPNYHLGESSHSSRSHGANNHAPPGFRAINGTKPRQVDPIRSIKPDMAGQVVSGVIEGEFDGGYLLTVKVRNSDITLKGVVFKSGQCVPITADNDVAPNIQMIHRNDVPLRSQGYSRVYNLNSRSRARNGSKLAPPPPSVHSVGPASGSIVPVLPSAPNQESSQPVALQVVHPSAESAEIGRKVPKVEEESMPEPMEQDTAAHVAVAAAESGVCYVNGARNAESHHRTQFTG